MKQQRKKNYACTSEGPVELADDICPSCGNHKELDTEECPPCAALTDGSITQEQWDGLASGQTARHASEITEALAPLTPVSRHLARHMEVKAARTKVDGL